MKKYARKRLAILLSIALASSVVVVYVMRPRFDKRVMLTQRNLRVTRQKISEFHSQFDTYPTSLAHLDRLYDPNDRGHRILRSEHITSVQGCNAESTEWNNGGGWRYDPNTGTLEVNATKPLRTYLPFYYGPERHEKPSDW